MKNIPEYVKDIMNRSSFYLGGYDPGYTIMIRKQTAYKTARTFEAECKRLVEWAKRNGATFSEINMVPNKTRHDYQYAIVTITDPVMKYIESYIKA